MLSSYSILFALAAMFFWSTGDFLLHRACKKVNYFQVLIYVNLTGAIILLPFAVRYFSQLNLATITPLIILSFFDLAFGLTILKAYEQGKLSVIEVILTLELPLTVFFGLVFFHESLTWLQTALVLIILSGIFFISYESKTFYQKVFYFFTRKKSVLEKGVIMTFSAAFFSALYNFFIAYNSRSVSPFITIWLPWTVSLFFLLLYFYFRHGFKAGLNKLINDIKNYKKMIFIGSFFDAISWVFYAAAVSKQELAIITAITESYPALAMFYGVKFDKEKISKLQYLGACLALGGSVVIAFVS